MHAHVYIYKYLDSISLGECPVIWVCFLSRFVFLLSYSTQICVCHICASVSLMDEICSNVYETLITALKCPCVPAAGGICHLLVSQLNGQASCALTWAVFLDSFKKFFILFYLFIYFYVVLCFVLICVYFFMLFCVLFYFVFIFNVILCFGCCFVFFCNCKNQTNLFWKRLLFYCLFVF